MSHPCMRSILQTLVVDGFCGGNIVDCVVQEYDECCVLGWFVH